MSEKRKPKINKRLLQSLQVFFRVILKLVNVIYSSPLYPCKARPSGALSISKRWNKLPGLSKKKVGF